MPSRVGGRASGRVSALANDWVSVGERVSGCVGGWVGRYVISSYIRKFQPQANVAIGQFHLACAPVVMPRRMNMRVRVRRVVTNSIASHVATENYELTPSAWYVGRQTPTPSIHHACWQTITSGTISPKHRPPGPKFCSRHCDAWCPRPLWPMLP